MKKLKKIVKYTLINILFVATIYYGFVENIEGAERLSLVIAWFIIICSWCALSDQVIELLSKNPPVIPRSIDVTFDFLVCAAFIWFGAVWTGAFYLLHIFLIMAARENAAKLNEEAKGDGQ